MSTGHHERKDSLNLLPQSVGVRVYSQHGYVGSGRTNRNSRRDDAASHGSGSWKRVMLRFDCELGVSPGVGRAIRVRASGILHAIESITITFNQQVVYTINRGSQGGIAQKLMNAVIPNSEDVDSVKTSAEWIYDLSRQNLTLPTQTTSPTTIILQTMTTL